MNLFHDSIGLRWMATFLCMVLLLSISGYSDADLTLEEGTTATTLPPKTKGSFFRHNVVIGFGDSITLGYPYVTGSGDGRRIGGYEPKLEDLLRNHRGRWRVLNYGLAGETTNEGVDRIASVVEGRKGAKILLLEGTNDFGWGISSATTIYNLGFMIDIARDAGLTPIISTLTPDSQPGVGSLKHIPDIYNPAIADLAQEKDVALCDQYAALIQNWDNWTYDSLHPNDAGYQVMADTWFLAVVVRP